MAYSMEEIEFGGTCISVAENEMEVSMDDDQNQKFNDLLWNLYCEEGKPRAKRKWIRAQLERYYLCMDKKPVWIEGVAIWPFHNNFPMTFIKQFSTTDNAVSQKNLAPEAELYVFGARIECEGGWDMVYKVIEQFEELRSLHGK